MRSVKLLALCLLALGCLLAGACRRQPKEPDVAQLLADPASSDSERSGKASLAIVAKGELAVPGLIAALKDRDSAVRQLAAKALGEIGPPAQAALPALGEAARLEGIRPTALEAQRRIQGGK